MKIKVFTVSHKDEIERSVNAWLADHPDVTLHHVRQSESMNLESWSLTITLVYSEVAHGAIGFEAVRS